MQVVLPELDGRLLTTAISFKAEESEVAGLEFARVAHQPAAEGIAAAARSASLWARLATTPRAERKLALVLSDYPGAAGQAAHAVGLDAIASTAEILRLLKGEGFDVGDTLPGNASLVAALCDAEPEPFLSLADYKRLFAKLDADARAKIVAAWGAPDDDPSVRDGHFTMRFARHGRLIAAIQPDRGNALDRKSSYHDPDLPPRHAYVAFYLWLREIERIHAMIHLGTHGTLEWLPGKAMALSSSCLPAALLGGLPVIYPFIVNNPGEAAAAKRRLGAVTIGHLTPPLKSAGHGNDTLELERLIDEYAAADGLDRRRTALLREEILDRAGAAGLLAESGADRASSKEDQLARLDAYLCDVKDLQIRDGLHVYGRAPDAAAPRRVPRLAGAVQPASARGDSRRALRSGRGQRARSAAHRARRQVRGPGSRPARRRAAAPMCCPPAAISTPSIRAPCRRALPSCSPRRPPRNCSAATSRITATGRARW